MSAVRIDPSAVVARLRAAGCVFAEAEARLLIEAAGTSAGLAELVDRRVAGFPLEHVVGWVEFAGRRIAVDPGVFVPRRRSELLVRQASALARPGAVVVDLCCGSGALGVALGAAVGPVELHAADHDPVAVGCARRNVTPLGGQVHLGDLFAALPGTLAGRVEVLLANVPYVPTGLIGSMPREARDHEPRSALDGGADGLDVARRVVREAPAWLTATGSLLFETGTEQVPAAVDAVTASGLRARVVVDDETGGTVVVGTSG